MPPEHIQEGKVHHPDTERIAMRMDLLDCVANLPPREGEFIKLWEDGLGELSQTEIAHLWKMSNANVTKIKQSALLHLRQCMSDKEYS